MPQLLQPFHRKIRFLLVFSLIPLALISPLSPSSTTASATGTSNFQFILKGHDGALLPGAVVGVNYQFPDSADSLGVFETAVANSSGVASFNIPTNAVGLRYAANPAASDTQNAIRMAADITPYFALSDGPITVQFSKGDLRIQLFNSNGTSAEYGLISVRPAPPSWGVVIRSGPINLDLGSFYGSGYSLNRIRALKFNYLFQDVNPYGEDQQWDFWLSRSDTGAVTVFTDMARTSQVPQVSGTLSLAFATPNLRIQLKNSDGSLYRFPDYGTVNPNASMNQGFVSVRPVDAFGNESVGPVFGGLASFSYFFPSGLAFATIKYAPSGRYLIRYAPWGWGDVPAFDRYIWVNDSGGIALSETGPFSNSIPVDIDFIIPEQRNFKFKIVSGDSVPEAGSATFLNRSTGWSRDFGTQTDGRGYINLPAGFYDISTRPYSGGSGGVFTLDMTGTNPILRNQEEVIVPITMSDSSYALVGAPPNVRFLAVNTSDTAVPSYYTMWKDKNWLAGNSTGAFTLANGTGYRLEINPDNSQVHSRKEVSFEVVNGVAVVSGVTVVGGILRIPLSSPNLLFKLVNPIDSSPVNGWAYACPVSGGNCVSSGVQNGVGGLNLPDGQFRVYASPPDNLPLNQKSYLARSDSGIVTVTGASNVGGIFEFVFDRPNVTGRIYSALTGQPLEFGTNTVNDGISLQLERKNGDFWNGTEYSSWKRTSLFGFGVQTPGEYRVRMTPYGTTVFASSVSSSFFVSNESGVSLNGTVWSESISSLVVTLETPNVTVRASESTTGVLLNSGWISVEKVVPTGTYWYGGTSISASEPGIARLRLEDGNYRLWVEPPTNQAGLTNLPRQDFDVKVETGVVTVKKKGSSIGAESGVFPLRLVSGNLQGRVVTSTSPATAAVCGNNQWVSINLQKRNSFSLNWDWGDWVGFNCSTGGFTHVISEPGTYRLRLEPQGFSGRSLTVSDSFVVTQVQLDSGASFDRGDILLKSPTISVAVRTQSSTTRLPWTGIAVRKGDEWIDWFSTGPNGIANINLTSAGNYTFEVNPSYEAQQEGATRKNYSVTATAQSDGNITAAVTPGSGVSISSEDNVTVLSLGVPNLRGIVHSPDSANVLIRNAQVLPIEISTNRDLWEYSTNTNDQGKWAISLPAGSYKIQARAPWGSNQYGNGKQIGTVNVDTNGVVTLVGLPETQTATDLKLELTNPRWTGQVFTPSINPSESSTTPIEYPWVCLLTNDRWSCATGDKDGRWAITPDYDFTSFSGTTLFDINDNYRREYPLLRFEGIGAVTSALVSDAGAQNLRHEMKGPNVSVEVRAGTPENYVTVPFVWVNLDRWQFNGQWLGGSSTNAQGIAKFSVESLTDSLTVTADVNGNPTFSSEYVRTVRTVSGTNTTSLTIVLYLDTPNLRGVLREPNTTPTQGAPVQWSWVNVYNDTKNFWGSGSGTDREGRFSLNLERPSDGSASLEYTITVYPGWNSASDYAINRFTAVVPSTGAIQIYRKGGNPSQTLSPENDGKGGLTFPLGEPSVVGEVVRPNGTGVVGSQILPIEAVQKQWLWESSIHSRPNGRFSLNLPDGSYYIEARRPWDENTLANSALCQVTVTSGQVVSNTRSASCVSESSTTKVKLALREPNVKFKLVDSTNAPIANAYIGVGYGSWHVWTNSTSTGDVALFIDTEAIALLNPWMNQDSGTAISVHMWIDPPWNSTSGNMVRWSCTLGNSTKAICKDLPTARVGNAYTVHNLETVVAQGPNANISVKNPNGVDKASFNSWVTLYKKVDGCDQCRNWIEGSRVDPNGKALFYVDPDAPDSATARYALEVWPAWEDRNTYAPKYHDNGGAGYSLESLTALTGLTINLASPNLKVRISAPNGTSRSKWAYANIEVINLSDSSVVRGYRWLQADQQGEGGALLEANASGQAYRLTVYPGNGQVGSTTECLLQSTGVGVPITLVSGQCSRGSVVGDTVHLNLSAGNVSGRVIGPDSQAVQGAIIYANYQETPTTAVVATSDSSGVFGLELGKDKNWTVVVVPMTASGVADSTLHNEVFPVTSGQLISALNLGDIRLRRK